MMRKVKKILDTVLKAVLKATLAGGLAFLACSITPAALSAAQQAPEASVSPTPMKREAVEKSMKAVAMHIADAADAAALACDEKDRKAIEGFQKVSTKHIADALALLEKLRTHFSPAEYDKLLLPSQPGSGSAKGVEKGTSLNASPKVKEYLDLLEKNGFAKIIDGLKILADKQKAEADVKELVSWGMFWDELPRAAQQWFPETIDLARSVDMAACKMKLDFISHFNLSEKMVELVGGRPKRDPTGKKESWSKWLFSRAGMEFKPFPLKPIHCKVYYDKMIAFQNQLKKARSSLAKLESQYLFPVSLSGPDELEFDQQKSCREARATLDKMDARCSDLMRRLEPYATIKADRTARKKIGSGELASPPMIDTIVDPWDELIDDAAVFNDQYAHASASIKSLAGLSDDQIIGLSNLRHSTDKAEPWETSTLNSVITTVAETLQKTLPADPVGLLKKFEDMRANSEHYRFLASREPREATEEDNTWLQKVGFSTESLNILYKGLHNINHVVGGARISVNMLIEQLMVMQKALINVKDQVEPVLPRHERLLPAEILLPQRSIGAYSTVRDVCIAQWQEKNSRMRVEMSAEKRRREEKERQERLTSERYLTLIGKRNQNILQLYSSLDQEIARQFNGPLPHRDNNSNYIVGRCKKAYYYFAEQRPFDLKKQKFLSLIGNARKMAKEGNVDDLRRVHSDLERLCEENRCVALYDAYFKPLIKKIEIELAINYNTIARKQVRLEFDEDAEQRMNREQTAKYLDEERDRDRETKAFVSRGPDPLAAFKGYLGVVSTPSIGEQSGAGSIVQPRASNDERELKYSTGTQITRDLASTTEPLSIVSSKKYDYKKEWARILGLKLAQAGIAKLPPECTVDGDESLEKARLPDAFLRYVAIKKAEIVDEHRLKSKDTLLLDINLDVELEIKKRYMEGRSLWQRFVFNFGLDRGWNAEICKDYREKQQTRQQIRQQILEKEKRLSELRVSANAWQQVYVAGLYAKKEWIERYKDYESLASSDSELRNKDFEKFKFRESQAIRPAILP